MSSSWASEINVFTFVCNSMLQELNRTGSNNHQDAQSNHHERDDPMGVSANRRAKCSMIYEPMSSEAPQTGHDREHNPNYRHLKAFARGEQSGIHCDVISAVGDRY